MTDLLRMRSGREVTIWDGGNSVQKKVACSCLMAELGFWFFLVWILFWEIKSRALHILGKYCSTELHPSGSMVFQTGLTLQFGLKLNLL